MQSEQRNLLNRQEVRTRSRHGHGGIRLKLARALCPEEAMVSMTSWSGRPQRETLCAIVDKGAKRIGPGRTHAVDLVIRIALVRFAQSFEDL